jgi:hypothetical protein
VKRQTLNKFLSDESQLLLNAPNLTVPGNPRVDNANPLRDGRLATHIAAE